MRRLGDRYLKWTAYGLLILLVTLLQATKGLIPPVFGVRPLLVVPLTVCIAMFTGPVGGAAAGIACGILWDLYAARLLGFNATMTATAVVLMGMPVAATTTVLAARYGADAGFAAQSMLVTTVLSLITIPLWAALL